MSNEVYKRGRWEMKVSNGLDLKGKKILVDLKCSEGMWKQTGIRGDNEGQARQVEGTKH